MEEQINTEYQRTEVTWSKKTTLVFILAILLCSYLGYKYGQFNSQSDVLFAENLTQGVTAIKYKDYGFATVVTDGFYGIEFNDVTINSTKESFRLGFDTNHNVSQLYIVDFECAQKYYNQSSPDFNQQINCFTTYSCGI